MFIRKSRDNLTNQSDVEEDDEAAGTRRPSISLLGNVYKDQFNDEETSN